MSISEYHIYKHTQCQTVAKYEIENEDFVVHGMLTVETVDQERKGTALDNVNISNACFQ